MESVLLNKNTNSFIINSSNQDIEQIFNNYLQVLDISKDKFDGNFVCKIICDTEETYYHIFDIFNSDELISNFIDVSIDTEKVIYDIRTMGIYSFYFDKDTKTLTAYFQYNYRNDIEK